MSDADYEKFEKLFSGSWTWQKDDNVEGCLQAIGMPDWMIEWDKNSKPSMVMSREGNNIKTVATMGSGDKQVTFNETMQLGVPRVVKDKEEDPIMVSNFCMTIEGDSLVDDVEPIKPPGKKYKVYTTRVGETMQSTYKVDDVSGSRLFTRAK